MVCLPFRAETNADYRDLIPVAGLVHLTTVDYPGRLALTVFTQGCPWRCPYCHNPRLQPRSASRVHWKFVSALLDERADFLEAVVFSGGEPTLHPGLKDAMIEVRRRGLLVGLHTAGIFPERLCGLLPLLNWVGLDIKAPLDERYTALTGDPQSVRRVLTSLALLQAGGIDHQLRTTVPDDATGDACFAAVREQLARLGASEPVRQSIRAVQHPTHREAVI